MKFALVDESRQVAFPGGRGSCPACGRPTVAKCGERIIWHWAHSGRRHCDPWWENETAWHREWKDRFPREWQEIVHHDPGTGEKHVADVKTGRGLVIELQNSSMSPMELRSRESFYGWMIWIVNAAPFEGNFAILNPLPDPTAVFSQDLRFGQPSRRGVGEYWRKSENPHGGPLYWMHSIRDIEAEIQAWYVGHHAVVWRRPRTVWFGATRPVFLDFGGEVLWRLGMWGDSDLRCVKRFDSDRLVQSLSR